MHESPTVIYNPDQHGIGEISRLHRQGVTILCPRCRSPFIVALTFEDARQHNTHPGVYCPQNRKHFTTLVELVSPGDFWGKIDAASDARERSVLIVLGDDSLELAHYKLYIDRNIHVTGSRFSELAPPNGIYLRLEPGPHRVVVREREVRKPHRLESNTIEIALRADEQVTLRVSLQAGHLVLAHFPCFSTDY